LAAMQTAGLRIEGRDGDLRITNARFVATPAQVGLVGLVLFSVKSYDTEASASSLGPILNDRTTILSLQNGIDNPDQIAALWGEQRVLAGVVYIGAEISSPGVIRHSSGGRIVFGQLDGQAGDSAHKVEQLFSGAQIPCELSREIQKVQWTKLLWNAPFCAISCLAGADTKQIVESKELTELAIGCMAEVQGAAQTRGITLPSALFDQTIGFSRTLGSFKPSMLQDLEAGKPLEYDAFNGIVVKLLHASGKMAPINQAFYALLQHLDKKSHEEPKR
jgi:2-dehydropantoate 2-reductase